MKDNDQFWIYTIFVIITLIGIIFFSGEYLKTKRENEMLKSSIAQRQDQNHQIGVMSIVINDLRRELMEAWNTSLICMDKSNYRDLYPCGENN